MNCQYMCSRCLFSSSISYVTFESHNRVDVIGDAASLGVLEVSININITAVVTTNWGVPIISSGHWTMDC